MGENQSSLPALTNGLNIAWTSSFLLKISRDENYQISENEASYFSVLNLVGQVVFSLLLSIVNVIDIFGRKPVLMSSAIPHSLAWILKAFSKDVNIFYVARFAAGAGDAIFIASLTIYISEITTPKVRGLWGNSLICMMYFGQFLINVIGAYCNIQQTSFITLAVPVVFLISFTFMPETPYFYLLKANDKKAKISLQKLRGRQDVEDELQILKVAVQKQISESGGWRDILLISSNRKSLFAALFLRISQVFSGILVFAAYTQYIFEKSGGILSAELSSIFYMGLSFVLYTTAAIFSDKLGRRKSYRKWT
ncbi:hypothetical protein JTB14_016790 [Gonioctena quinquepunctata]|nr:hypothetical protein JTB14_016790 [Gonioctena quinquepunctata]